MGRGWKLTLTARGCHNEAFNQFISLCEPKVFLIRRTFYKLEACLGPLGTVSISIIITHWFFLVIVIFLSSSLLGTRELYGESTLTMRA